MCPCGTLGEKVSISFPCWLKSAGENAVCQFRGCRIKPTLVQRLLLELNKNQCDAMFVLLGAVKMRRDRTETEEGVGSKARKGRNIITF